MLRSVSKYYSMSFVVRESCLSQPLMDVLLSSTKAVISKTDAVCSLMTKFFSCELGVKQRLKSLLQSSFCSQIRCNNRMNETSTTDAWGKLKQTWTYSFNLEDHQHWMDRNNKEQTPRTSTKCWTRNFFSCQMSRLVLDIKRYFQF